MDFKKLSVTLAVFHFTAYSLISYAGDESSYFGSRAEVQQFAHELAEREGLDENDIKTALSSARYLPSVIKAILPPASPNVKSWTRYRARYLDRTRIAAGVDFWRENAAWLKRAENDFGVPAEIIVAIIGVETIYGRHTGNYQTLSALATLAFDYPPRAELFRTELGEVFLLAREQKRPVTDFKGSYAGAIGLPQFLPSSIRRYAVDYDGDGKIDIETSPADAIGSVANFLNRHGWKSGEPIAVPARVFDPQRAAAAIAAGIVPQFNTEAFQQLGISADIPVAPDLPAALIDLVTPNAPTEYWLGYNNFYVITRYNRSSFYAMAVYQLATAIMLERNKRLGTQ
ncbi:MAG: lytic murein transglycosylase B [Betaproteobacteria bacterium]|nr:lytic murein transglycosylase B [Betaproteobacteria bacterium]